MKNKKHILSALCLLAAAALMLCLWLGQRPEPSAGEKTVTVTIVHSDGSEKAFSCNTDLEYLGGLLVEEGLASGETGAYGLTIYTADGETADWDRDHSYWAIYIGTEYATTGADGIALTDGGEYSLVYTIG